MIGRRCVLVSAIAACTLAAAVAPASATVGDTELISVQTNGTQPGTFASRGSGRRRVGGDGMAFVSETSGRLPRDGLGRGRKISRGNRHNGSTQLISRGM